MKVFVCVMILNVFNVAKGCSQDEVKNIPGQPITPEFKMYSGFLDGFYEGHNIHYV